MSEWEILHVPVSASKLFYLFKILELKLTFKAILSTDKFEELSADPNFRLASHVRIVD